MWSLGSGGGCVSSNWWFGGLCDDASFATHSSQSTWVIKHKILSFPARPEPECVVCVWFPITITVGWANGASEVPTFGHNTTSNSTTAPSNTASIPSNLSTVASNPASTTATTHTTHTHRLRARSISAQVLASHDELDWKQKHSEFFFFHLHVFIASLSLRITLLSFSERLRFSHSVLDK